MKEIITSVIALCMVVNLSAQIHIESGGSIYIDGVSSIDGTINAAPELYSEGAITNLGTLQNNGEMQLGDDFTNNGTFTSTGDDVFQGNVGPTISGSFTGANDFYNLILQNSGGVYLNTNVDVDQSINLINGVVHTGTNSLYLKNTSNTAILNASTSGGYTNYLRGNFEQDIASGITYSFPIGDAVHGNQTVQIQFNSLGGATKVMAHYDASAAGANTMAACNDANAYNVQSGTWDITANGVNGTYDYDITLQMAGANSAVLAASLYNAFVKDGQFISDPCIQSLSNTNAMGLNSFSQFKIVGGSNTALPVELKDFKVYKSGKTDVLEWTTLSERNNSHFDIERSRDGLVFDMIGSVVTNAKDGNSNLPLKYYFIDEKPMNGLNYYRLKQVDHNQNIKYSGVRYVVWDNNITVLIYPNPATDNVHINADVSNSGEVLIKLFDMQGKLIKSVQAKSIQGKNDYVISVSDIAKGIYTIQLYNNNKLIHVEKLNKN